MGSSLKSKQGIDHTSADLWTETWEISKNYEKSSIPFERNILRCIYSPEKIGATWRRRTNQEIYYLLNEPDVARVVRLSRLRWAGYVSRIGPHEIQRKLLKEEIYGTRLRGHLKFRWTDGIGEDSRTVFGVQNWSLAALDQLLGEATLVGQGSVLGCHAGGRRKKENRLHMNV